MIPALLSFVDSMVPELTIVVAPPVPSSPIMPIADRQILPILPAPLQPFRVAVPVFIVPSLCMYISPGAARSLKIVYHKC